jgi:hypothetical protein
MVDVNHNNPTTTTYVLGIGVQGVPHGSDNLRHFTERSVGILTFDGGLGVPEEKSVRRDGPVKMKF